MRKKEKGMKKSLSARKRGHGHRLRRPGKIYNRVIRATFCQLENVEVMEISNNITFQN